MRSDQIVEATLFASQTPLSPAEIARADGDLDIQTVLEAVEAESPALVVIDAEPITHIDTTAAEELDGLIDELEQRGVEVRIARLERSVTDTLRRCDVELGERVYNLWQSRISWATPAVPTPPAAFSWITAEGSCEPTTM